MVEITEELLNNKNREIGKLIGSRVPAGVGFALLLFNMGESGWMNYISNARREDMVKAMRELLFKIEGEDLTGRKDP